MCKVPRRKSARVGHRKRRVPCLQLCNGVGGHKALQNDLIVENQSDSSVSIGRDKQSEFDIALCIASNVKTVRSLAIIKKLLILPT